MTVVAGPDGDGFTHWPAPAKLNLFLQITGCRADGYHNLQTVFRLLHWGDRIAIRPRSDGLISRIGPGLAGVAEAEDLAIRAAKRLHVLANGAQGADIIVKKFIPAGAGLGGGSSDAATVLVALNLLWGTGLNVDALAALGLELGADVPVFVRGHNAWATGLGEQLTPVMLPDTWYVVAWPGVHAPTARLFSVPGLTRDSPPATMADFVSGRLACNAFEPVLRTLEPSVDAGFRALEGAGPRLSGSGSAVFCECTSRGQAETLLARLPEGCSGWVVQGAAHSPLLDAVERYTGASPSG